MEFRVLGRLEVADRAEPLDLGTPRQRRFLGLLLLAAPDTVSYDRLAEQLWEGDPPGTARHTLQGYAHRARRGLDAEAWRLETRQDGYALKVSADELDAIRFEELTQEGRRALVRGDAPTAAQVLAQALALWRGLPYEDLGDLTAFEAERARLGALRLTAVQDRVDAELALGRHEPLIPELEQLLSEHPFEERLWGQLMLAAYRSGRQADALEAFRRARHVLADEVGIEPSRWLCGLQEQILLQDPDLDPPEPARPPVATHNLPAARSSFVGRHRELADLDGLVRTNRLVTVTGPPGVGKSRLALEAAARLTEDYPQGVFLVRLAEVGDPAVVPSSVATAIGVPSVAEQATEQTLREHLRPRRLVLLLDNVEHLLDAAPQIAALLDAAPRLTVLATSRAPLRLAGEQEYPLPPLQLPDPEDPARESDAVRLFADRAGAIDPRLRIGADRAALVADIVARLDGLPLAIELAAARLRLFPLEELRRRLDPALPLLSDGTVEHPRHQQTLRGAIAWSEGLLAPDEQAVLRRLGVFQGGISLEAAQAVAGAGPEADLTAPLSRLVEVGLLNRPEADGPARFTMLQTIREYALEQLQEAGEEADTRGRHAHFHAALIDEAAPHLTQAEQALWLTRLDADHANLRAALSWVLASGDADLALGMTAGLWRYWQLRGHLAEGRRWLDAALALDGGTPEARVRALLGVAGLCYWQFDLDAAESAYTHARELARGTDWWLELEALFGLVATLACHRGDLDEAEQLEQEFQALAAEHDDLMAMGLGLAASQMMRLLADDLEESRRYGELCLAGTRQIGERWYEVQILRTLALTSLRQERYEQARDELRECVEIADELGDLAGMAMDLDRLGQVAALLGEPERACVLAGAADRLRESAGAMVTVKAFRWEQEPAPVTARRTLENTAVERAWAEGRVMTTDAAVAYALAPHRA